MTRVERIRDMRRNCMTWDEIAASLQIPRSTAFVALLGRRRSQRIQKRDLKLKKQLQLIRTLRATVRHLEAKLREKEMVNA